MAETLIKTLAAMLLTLGTCGCTLPQTPIKNWQYTIGITVNYQADDPEENKRPSNQQEP